MWVRFRTFDVTWEFRLQNEILQKLIVERKKNIHKSYLASCKLYRNKKLKVKYIFGTFLMRLHEKNNKNFSADIISGWIY